MHYPSALLQVKKYFSFHFHFLSEVLSRWDLMHKLRLAVGLEVSIYFSSPCKTYQCLLFFCFFFFLASNSSVLKIVFSFLLNVCTLTMCNWMWFSITIANTECWLNKKILLLQKRFLVVVHTGVCVAVQPVGK